MAGGRRDVRQDRADAARAGVERARTDSRAQFTRAGLASRWQAWAEACQYHGSDPDVDYRRMGEEASVKVRIEQYAYYHVDLKRKKPTTLSVDLRGGGRSNRNEARPARGEEVQNPGA